MAKDTLILLSERITNLETKHNDLCETLSELNLKKVIDFEDFKVDEDDLDFNEDISDDPEEEDNGTGF